MSEDKFFKVRLTPNLHKQLEHWAEFHRRSMTQEIIGRLEGAIDKADPKEQVVFSDVPPALTTRIKLLAKYYDRDPDAVLVEALNIGMQKISEDLRLERGMEQELALGELGLSENQFAEVLKYAESIAATPKGVTVKGGKKR